MEWRRHDRTTVLECLQRGEYDAIATTSQGALDELAHLTAELGVWDALEVIQVHREREGIPDHLLLRTLTVLPFIEAVGLSAAANMLFQDAAILLQLGYAVFEIQHGFNECHHAPLASKSDQFSLYHPEVLRQELARLDLASLHTFRKRCIRALFERRLVRGKTYAIEGSGLGKHWRVVGILNVNPARALWVTWRVLSGSASEKGQEAAVVHECPLPRGTQTDPRCLCRRRERLDQLGQFHTSHPGRWCARRKIVGLSVTRCRPRHGCSRRLGVGEHTRFLNRLAGLYLLATALAH